MRSTWLPLGLALVLPSTVLLSACGPGNTSSDTGGSSSTTTTSVGGSGGATTTVTGGGGAGTGGTTGGAGGSIGGGGAGGFAPPANDICPGDQVNLAIDASTTINGTLKGATDDYTTFCADDNPAAGAPDVVYQLDVPAAATVTLEVIGSGFIPALSLRRQECSQRLPGDGCLNLGTGDVKTTLALEAGTYWVVVDSADGAVGNFTFKVTYATGSCGDGAVNPGEQCDPAVPANDDGCINPGMPNSCHYGEPPPDPAIVACPGGLVTISKGDGFPLGPYNNGSGMHNEANQEDPSGCVAGDDPNCCGYAAVGPEDVFHILPLGDGILTAQIGHDEDGVSLYCDNHADCGDFVMYLRQNTCHMAAAADELLCADYTPNPNDPFGFDEVLTITVPVTALTDYWLVVDGLDDTYGIGGYYLQLSLQ